MVNKCGVWLVFLLPTYQWFDLIWCELGWDGGEHVVFIFFKKKEIIYITNHSFVRSFMCSLLIHYFPLANYLFPSCSLSYSLIWERISVSVWFLQSPPPKRTTTLPFSRHGRSDHGHAEEGEIHSDLGFKQRALIATNHIVEVGLAQIEIPRVFNVEVST